MNKELLKLFQQVVTWITRRRIIGILIMKIGAALLLPKLSFHALALYIKIENIEITAFLNDPFTQIIENLTFGIGVVLIFIGMILAIHDYLAIKKANSKRRVVCVEFIGMIDTTGTPLKEYVPTDKSITRIPITIDIRPEIKLSGAEGLSQALDKLSRLKSRLDENYQDLDRADVEVYVGGIMPVSLLFYAGVLLDDQFSINLMDWNRSLERWQVLDGNDDGGQFTVRGLSNKLSREVVLNMSVSYQVNKSATQTCFPGLDLIELFLESPKANNLFSDTKQAALAQQFLDTLSELTNLNVEHIHLVLAAPSSFCLRLGRHYDPKNHPPLTIYEYDKGKSPAYPWGLTMPTYGNVSPKIELMEVV